MEIENDNSQRDIEKNSSVVQEKMKNISFFKLFSFSSRYDIVLLIIGMTASVGIGLIWPLVILVFGEVTDTLTDFRYFEYGLIQKLLQYNETVPLGANLQYILKRIKYYEPLFEVDDKYNIMKVMRMLCQYYAEIAVGMFLLSYTAMSCLMISAQKQISKIRIAFFRAIMRQNIGWFDEQSSGTLNNHLVDNINIIHDGIGQKIGQMIQWISCGTGALILAFVKGWKLTLVSLAVSPLLALTMFLLTRIMTSLNKHESIAYGKAGAIAEEVLGSIRTVVAFRGEEFEVQRYTKNLEYACRAGKKKGILTGIIVGLLGGLIFGSFSLGFWYGGKMVREKELVVGSALIIFFSCMLTSLGFGQAFPHFSTLNRARTAAAKIFEIIDRVPYIDKMSELGIKLEIMTGKIEFRNVNFHYPTRPESLVLHDFSLNAEAGQTVALVGTSGCGKSSVVQLIQRFYDVNNGDILIDGVKISDFNVMWLREQIGVVSQEPILFGCSIIENIKYGRPNVTDEEIEKAIRIANAKEFIYKLPNKLDTILGDGGAQLSGGQKQRIAIARAIVRNPKILLLDEATSALDSESEKNVQEALNNTRIGRTTIIVAHRLSTIKNADVIFCIKDGQVVEHGNHDYLISLNGLYSSLIENQKVRNNNDKKEEISEDAIKEISPNNTFVKDKLHSNTLFPSKEEVKTKESKNYFLRVMKLNLPEKWFICLGCFGALLNGASQPGFSVLFGYIIPAMADRDIQKQEKTIEKYVLMIASLAVITFIANIIQNYGFAESGERLTKRCRSFTFRAMLRQDMEWFDKACNSVGMLTTRLSDEASCIRGLSGESFGLFSQAISSIGVAVVISLIYAWQIALLTLSFIPFILIGGYLQVKTMQGPSSSDKKNLEESGKVATEGIENIRTVTNLTRERTFIDKYERKIFKMMKDLSKKSQIQALLFGFTQAVVVCSYSAIFITAGYLLNENMAKMEDIYIAFGAIIFGAIFFGSSFSMGPNFGKGIIAAKNLFSLLDRKPQIDSYSDEGIEMGTIKEKGVIELKNIIFKYPSRPTVTILNDLKVDIEPNTTVALVGQSGCGKSTIIQLLQRMYDINKGNLNIYDVDIKSIRLGNLRELFGLVSQEPVLFSYSIKENIAYADIAGKYRMKKIQDAAKAANIHDFIMNLPDKYNTIVGEKGSNLSGGQKQRIAIARALLRNPKILLLDEATSALDSESEKIVQEALDRAQEGRTCIVIAHRLSTIQNADRILVFDNGKIAEMGTHDELIRKNGLYNAMLKNIN